ncbi:uncharacterized protein LOC129584837 [Paramacrobiotus metropolitanus]|uniref:uncharacterized protein LOC129584837 n=1 Tax=Paramacrobiotus metropolitanus TaxID=2943436 RepID=UPI002446283E|nr:uncharacterized protein LOC129584837 [Paramacrobiotus metropolitanus]
MKLTTYVVSHLTKDPTFRPEFPDDRWTDEVFPDSSAFFEQFVPKLECLKTAAFSRLKEQFIALIVAFSCLHSDSARDCNEGILKYLNRFLSFAKTDDELLELIVYVVVGWWNHDGVGSVLDGTNVADDFGLQSSMKLISRFLVSLLDVKIISVDSGVKFFCASDTDLKEWEDGFYLIRDSDVVLLKEVCSRIMADCSEDEPVYQEAYLMEKHITQSARC